MKVEEVWSVFTDFIEARSIFETFFGQRVCRRARKPRTTMKGKHRAQIKRSKKDDMKTK